MTWIMSKSLALLQWVRFGRRRGSQPTVAMPSVAEAEPAEFAETAAMVAPEIERFFWWGKRSGGARNFALLSHRPERPLARACRRSGRREATGGLFEGGAAVPPRGMSAIPSMAAARVAAGVTSLTGHKRKNARVPLQAWMR